jgi:uncharacterized MnhB-related membrane protein
MLTTIVLITMVALAFMAVREKDLLYAAIYLAGVSVMVSIIFLTLSAPDIALTEVAVGAGLSTFVMVAAIKKTQRMEK